MTFNTWRIDFNESDKKKPGLLNVTVDDGLFSTSDAKLLDPEECTILNYGKSLSISVYISNKMFACNWKAGSTTAHEIDNLKFECLNQSVKLCLMENFHGNKHFFLFSKFNESVKTEKFQVHRKGHDLGWVAGIVIVVVIAASAFGCIVWCKKKNNSKESAGMEEINTISQMKHAEQEQAFKV
uniref:Catechol O-methyltransferase-like n=1 Tax=Phallusia mammillata TaxID=59560 RepID=A0A6F9DKR3_9ASCI|nr:catechol O-methyltransferase-like [Phallusia mammillata]